MKNVLKSRWFMISLTVGITAVVTAIISIQIRSIRYASDSNRIDSSTAVQRVANYGKWAGKMSDEILTIAHNHDSSVLCGCMPDSFITFWTIGKKEINSFMSDNKSATGVRLFLSFEYDTLFTQLTQMYYRDQPTKEDSIYFTLLKNIAKAMKSAHLVMEPVLNDDGSKAYFDLIEPCPSMCDTKYSVLYPIYQQAFKNGYDQ